MRAVVATPGRPDSGRLVEVPDPLPGKGEALVRVHQVGLDGTDAEIIAGEFGEPPAGEKDLIIGHESLGRIEAIPNGDHDLAVGDWVVAMVRRPDPEPCLNCAAEEWDMCLNGGYTERGIKGRHGYLAERYAEEPRFLVKVPEEVLGFAVLLEPLSIVEKALEHIQRIGSRMVWRPQRALVLGAGPIGLLAALLLRREGLQVHVYDRTEEGTKRDVSEAMGAGYVWAKERPLDHGLNEEFGVPDIVVEATGFSPLAFNAIDVVGSNGIVCLTGVSGGSRELQVSADHLNLEMVLMNKVVFGTVSANRRHFQAGIDHMRAVEARWPGVLARMITRRLPVEAFAGAFERSPDDVKSVVEVAAERAG